MDFNTDSHTVHLVNRVTEHLGPDATGPVSEEHVWFIRSILESEWETFTGDNEGLTEMKLHRAEAYIWEPPCVKFTIERHGAMQFGSSRAELQEWTINLDTKWKECRTTGYRQISKRQPPWDADPVAEEIAAIILAGDSDDRIEWESPTKAKIFTREFVPSGSQQTTQYRKKRFYEELDGRLMSHGWKRQLHIYMKT